MTRQQGTSLATHYQQEFSSYSRFLLCRDLYAGVTVSLLLIPQALAYALLAGVPLASGIITASVGAFIAAACGSSRHMIAGPTNATAILIQAGIAQILAVHYGAYSDAQQLSIVVQLLAELTLLVGVIQVLAGALRFGRLASRIKREVSTGYILGAAMALSVNQLYIFLGVEKPENGGMLLSKVAHLVMELPSLHFLTTLVGLASLFFYLLFLRVFPRLPHALMMLGGAVLTALWLGWEPESGAMTAGALSNRVLLVGDMGGVKELWQMLSFPLPAFHHFLELFPAAIAIACLSSIEGISVSQAMARSSGQDPSLNRDVGSLGVANIASAFVGGMPNSGSPSRSALNLAMGAETRLAAMTAALSVLVIVTLFSEAIAYIPLASLSALLLVTVFRRLVSPKEIKEVLSGGWGPKLTLLTTVVAALFFDLDNAFFLGVLVSSLAGKLQKS